MYNRLYNYLKKYNILSESQFGFREGHSTYMALLVLLENIVNTLEKGHSAVGLFLDFKKAFDTVDHDLLLQKWTYMVSEEMSWIGFPATCETVNKLLFITITSLTIKK